MENQRLETNQAGLQFCRGSSPLFSESVVLPTTAQIFRFSGIIPDLDETGRVREQSLARQFEQVSRTALARLRPFGLNFSNVFQVTVALVSPRSVNEFNELYLGALQKAGITIPPVRMLLGVNWLVGTAQLEVGLEAARLIAVEA